MLQSHVLDPSGNETKFSSITKFVFVPIGESNDPSTRFRSLKITSAALKGRKFTKL